jgi:hypothetical protein
MTLGLSDLAFLGSTSSLLLYPAYVQDYLDRVTAADVAAGNTLGLERGVTDAFSTCLQALVADGILGVSGGVLTQAASLIKASCAMQGARTLPGSLVPLADDMPKPTNFNFVSGDYNRRTGLLGNGSTKYLNSNRNNNADPQDSKHLAVYSTTPDPGGAGTRGYIGASYTATGWTAILEGGGVNTTNQIWLNSTSGVARRIGNSTGFLGVSRSNSTQITGRNGGSNTIFSQSSQVPSGGAIFVFAAGSAGDRANARLNFYSIGEFLDLAILDARITALSTAIQAAIAP